MENTHWFMRATHQFIAGERTVSLDLIYDTIDNMLIIAEFEKVDQLLQEIDIHNTPTTLLIGVLTITLTACDQLSFRAEFFNSIQSELKQRDKLIPGMLDGLDKWR
jgi:hypothetical protein